jgi:hypothetical protein
MSYENLELTRAIRAERTSSPSKTGSSKRIDGYGSWNAALEAAGLSK